MKYFKKNSYLIAYFGDQTFAWNEASSVKPFRMYFSQMEKQSNSEHFSYAVNCALDEISRRVEYGLACPCLLEESRAKMKSQIDVDSGIQEESNMRIVEVTRDVASGRIHVQDDTSTSLSALE
ncbi:hypothetical protein HAX54_051612 [Datura stramonium]|uniref:PWWP domain-containing protein n=1 Tax=Datura stramonium TaxID=4076 RepID=A0ABS8WRJ9_DATST|nr:hypothetical protein [Datura stramonium]